MGEFVTWGNRHIHWYSQKYLSNAESGNSIHGTSTIGPEFYCYRGFHRFWVFTSWRHTRLREYIIYSIGVKENMRIHWFFSSLTVDTNSWGIKYLWWMRFSLCRHIYISGKSAIQKIYSTELPRNDGKLCEVEIWGFYVEIS